MLHCDNWISAKIVFVFITLVASMAANALMLDCSTTQALPGTECVATEGVDSTTLAYAKDKAPSVSTNTTRADFQINQDHQSSNFAPLLVLLGVLLAALLVRAKRFNTK